MPCQSSLHLDSGLAPLSVIQMLGPKVWTFAALGTLASLYGFVRQRRSGCVAEVYSVRLWWSGW